VNPGIDRDAAVTEPPALNAAAPAHRTRRLLAVCAADPGGRYEWLPATRPGDVTVALDGMAHDDLAPRRPILFDDLESWEERDAVERRVGELMQAVRAAPAVSAIELGGYRLIDLADLRLWTEMAHLLRGWKLAGAAAGATEIVCDPGAPAALAMGARAALGLDPASVPYTTPPALPGSRVKRAAARPLMAAIAAVSRPARVRVAAVVAGKLMLALNALPDAELRGAGIGTMPLPGLDHGNGALLSLRRRLPMLATYGPRRPEAGVAVRLPELLGIERDPRLDRALTVLVRRLLNGVAPELDGLVRALARLEGARELRALLLPSAGYGASRLLIEWAHRRELRVGAMQHGIYCFRELHGNDDLADMVFSWGEGTAEQTRDWPAPRPALHVVGVPGTPPAPPRAPIGRLRRALIATTFAADTPIAPVTYAESFIGALAPSLPRLAGAGVELQLRTHPSEDPERYRRLLARQGLQVALAPSGSFAQAAQRTDILIASASSVAFEAAALGLPVLLWLGAAPRWLRENHLVAPWVREVPGMFTGAEGFARLAESLLEHPAETLRVAHELGGHLARFARPFDPVDFAEGIRLLAG
jgi:hypothetical protein